MNANKSEVDHQLISPDDVKIDFPLHGQSAIGHLRNNLRSRVSEIPQTCWPDGYLDMVICRLSSCNPECTK